jgi:6,7-dimethyl-8-ribityllumazine synthase
MNNIVPDMNAQGAQIAVIVSRFNESVTRKLLDGATEELRKLGVSDENITVAWVPGAHEIPVVARAFAKQGVSAIVAVGCVVRGETAHFDYVAGECCRGLTNVSLDFGLPVANGVLTVENGQQAYDRCGGSKGNKGAEAAAAAVETLNLLRNITNGR